MRLIHKQIYKTFQQSVYKCLFHIQRIHTYICTNYIKCIAKYEIFTWEKVNTLYIESPWIDNVVVRGSALPPLRPPEIRKETNWFAFILILNLICPELHSTTI